MNNPKFKSQISKNFGNFFKNVQNECFKEFSKFLMNVPKQVEILKKICGKFLSNSDSFPINLYTYYK